MSGLKILNKYYSNDPHAAAKILINHQNQQQLLEDNCLLIFLRYVENMQHMEDLSIIKTLLLVARLAKIDNIKIRKLFPHKYLLLERGKKQKGSFDQELLGLMMISLTNYVNFLLREEDEREGEDEQEMRIVTANLNELKKSCYSKNPEIVKCCESVYWLAEEAVFQLWLKVDKQLISLQDLEESHFQAFYQQYCTFCTYRRKIPTIRHPQLKCVDITHEANRRVEERKREISNSKINSQSLWMHGFKGMQHILRFTKINADDSDQFY